MKITWITLIATLLMLNSCIKKGCTDSTAFNYNEEANKEDNSCQYQGKTSFWFNENISNWLVNNYNVTSLTVYMDNVEVGTMDPADWKVGPDCDGDNFTVINDLGNNQSYDYSYMLNDQTGTQRFNGTVTVTANTCSNVQLYW